MNNDLDERLLQERFSKCLSRMEALKIEIRRMYQASQQTTVVNEHNPHPLPPGFPKIWNEYHDTWHEARQIKKEIERQKQY